MKRIPLLLLSATLLVAACAQPQPQAFQVIPMPNDVTLTEGCFVVKGAQVAVDPAMDELSQKAVGRFVEALETATGAKTKAGDKGFRFAVDAFIAPESYVLEIGKDGVDVKASDLNGFVYACETIKQMLPAAIYGDKKVKADWVLPCASILDQPRFDYRGMHLDPCRHFFSVEETKKYLDVMTAYKLNRFHWHLTEDQGWRMEVKAYPKLTEIGAWRNGTVIKKDWGSNDGIRYGGFYTQEEMKEIVAYAADRNIEIIPEVDLPGHSKALAVSYPEVVCKHDADVLSVQGEVHNVLCVGREKNYEMLENIIKELAAIFPSKYFHVGVEEVATDSWKHCPECQKLMKKLGYTDEKQLLGYFTGRMEKILAKYGKTLEGWEDIVAGETLSRNDLVLVWHRQNVLQKAIDAGFPVVTQNCDYLYLDMKHSPVERGMTWASIIDLEKVYSFDPLQGLELTPEKKRLVRGLQGGLWTELLYYPAHFSEYQLFPRLCAVAEAGWTPQEQREFADFDARLAHTHYERMWNMGIRFRIPYPEVDTQGNVRCPYPNMVVRYTADGSEPTVSSPVVTGPIVADHPEKLRFATFFADVKSMTVGVPGSQKYLKPAVKVTSSLEGTKSLPLSNLELYETDKYMRTVRAPQKGDYVLFTFEEPVSCKWITVQTADPKNNFYGITDGHVEVLFDDGTDTWTSQSPGDAFDMYNRVRFYAAVPVKAVKIVVDGPGEGKPVSIQSLIIE
jgi:N-acetyl-beta-hexosaminidase